MKKDKHYGGQIAAKKKIVVEFEKKKRELTVPVYIQFLKNIFGLVTKNFSEKKVNRRSEEETKTYYFPPFIW